MIRQNQTLSAAGLVSAIRQEVASFCGSAPQSDDMTILVLMRE